MEVDAEKDDKIEEKRVGHWGFLVSESEVTVQREFESWQGPLSLKECLALCGEGKGSRLACFVIALTSHAIR